MKKTKKTNAKPIPMPDSTKRAAQKKGRSKDTRQLKNNTGGAKTGLSCPGSAFSSKKGSSPAPNGIAMKAANSNVHSLPSSNRQSCLGLSLRQSPMPPREHSFGSMSRQGDSRGQYSICGQEKAAALFKPVQSEKFFTIMPTMNGQMPMTIKKTDIKKPTSNEKKQNEGAQLNVNEISKKIADAFYTNNRIEDQQIRKASPDKSSRPVKSQNRKQNYKAATAAINSNNSFNNIAVVQ